MSRPLLPEDEQLLDLLAARATQGLTAEEARRLESLVREYPAFEDSALELAAAAIDLALTPHAALPPGLRLRLQGEAQRWEEAAWAAPSTRRTGGAAPRSSRGPVPLHPSRSRFMEGAGWMVAAVCLVLAVLGWWPRLVTTAPALARQREALMTRPGTVVAPWSEWDEPEIAGVGGDVVWSERDRRGFLRFSGLPRNDPSRERYHLWIVPDPGESAARPAPISGAMFDGGPGEIIVPFAARTVEGCVHRFAVTLEDPGGAPTPDMARRVVIARLP